MPEPELGPEDDKLVTLARSVRARTGAPEGAAVRDTDGRSYAAATVALASLRLSALQAAVAAAVSSGAPGLEAAAVVGGRPGQEALDAVYELGPNAPVFLADASGQLVDVVPAATR